ncbi:MAG: hypothetical protein IPJ41_09120 [Phycisphaerales bacterium]|nr:hypothetical protein [Phycisphaerales bacterium]
MDDFDEDADFERDPEVEQVVRGIPVGTSKARPRAERPVARPTEPAEPGPGGELICSGTKWRVATGFAGAAAILAAVLAGINAGHDHWAYVLITLYWAVLHTASGVGAVILAGLLLGRPVGRLDVVAARMALAVSLFLVVFRLEFPFPGGVILATVLAAGAYFGGVVVAFRLPPRDAAVIGGAHFGLAILIGLGSMLSGVIQAGAVSAGVPQ